MRKILALLILSCLVFSLSAYAEGNYVQKSVDKAKQGFTNILTGWLEVPYQVVKGYKGGWREKDKNKALGGFFGIFRGVVHGVGRTVTGVYEVATFPLPNPKINEGIGIPLDGKNVWDEGTQYSLLNNGIQPVGKKLQRGVVNAAFGIFDLPGQIGKGFSQDKPIKALAKAIVFPLGRIASGVYETVTFLLPGDAVNYGYPLSEKDPWDGFEKSKWDSGL